MVNTRSPDPQDNGLLATRRSEIATGVRPAGRAQDRILEATEELLTTVPYHELNVAHILATAAVTRPTFYSYFASKAEVVSALFTRAASEVHDGVRPLFDRPHAVAPAQAISQAIAGLAHIYETHRAVLAATAENRHAIPQIETATERMLGIFVDEISQQVDRDRADGLAPPGPDSAALVAMLVRSTDQVLYIAGRGRDPRLPDEQAAVGLLTAMWLRTLYGWVPTATAS